MLLFARSLLFNTLFYTAMLVMGIIGLPFVAWSRAATYWWMKQFVHLSLWMLRVICKIETEVRGPVPDGQVVVAAKHQSFLDILILFLALPRARFVMKRELRWAPVLGLYAWRIGSIPVNRGQKGKAMRGMIAKAEAENRHTPAQTVIYPQGSRIAPRAVKPYKIGAAVLAARMDQPIVPAATNAGWFWGRNTVRRYPGTAIVTFLPTIDQGQSPPVLTEQLRDVIEPASEALPDRDMPAPA